jgi:hypothetical protein
LNRFRWCAMCWTSRSTTSIMTRSARSMASC